MRKINIFTKQAEIGVKKLKCSVVEPIHKLKNQKDKDSVFFCKIMESTTYIIPKVVEGLGIL